MKARGKFFLSAVLVFSCSGWAEGAVFTVTNSADAGIGTLRWAIDQANLNPGRDTITFQVAPTGAPATIQLASALPVITDSVIIDGWSQLGGPTCQPGIELNGLFAGVASGLTLATTNSQILGLCINRFQLNGLVLQAGGRHTVYGCYIGTDLTGSLDYGNGRDGILIDSSSGNSIGYTPTSSCTNRNIISGNDGCGIRMTASLGPCTQNFVQNNHIGVDVTGLLALGNGEDGVHLETADVNQNYIGSTATPKPINVISANGSNGVCVADSGGHFIQGNHIGCSRDGTTNLGNGACGVLLTNASGCVVGEDGGEGINVISGNGLNGVEIGGVSAAGNFVVGNYIGVMSNGMAALPNDGDGVRLTSQCTQNRIGQGTSDLAGNVISGNKGCGVRLTDTAYGNWVYNNFIGLDAAGIGGVGNKQHGILIEQLANGNAIGSSSATNSGNVISGNGASNDYHGVCLDTGAYDNEVAQNIIGLNTVNSPVANAGDGVRAQHVPANRIGGIVDNARNVISGNAGCGIQIGPGAMNTLVAGNYIGIDTNGVAPRGNALDGVLIKDSSSNQVGVTGAPPNIISANLGNGVRIANALSKENMLVKNWIGVDSAGGTALGNTNHGVHIFGSPGNIVGGPGGLGNLVSGNGMDGVCLEGAGAISNIVAANFVGVDVWGTAMLGNQRHGVSVFDASRNLIGDPLLGGNIIGGNTSDGIHIEGGSARSNLIGANLIGRDAIMGTIALPNGGDGVWVGNGASDNVIGDYGPTGNFIWNNMGAGVRLADGTNNAVRGNSIYQNAQLGIDLGLLGVDANDVQDPDVGANFLQNAPVLYEATTGSVVIAGLLNSVPSTVFTMQFYRCGSVPDSSGYGEGFSLLGVQSVTTDPSGTVVFEFSLSGSIDTGEWITATAMDPWGNSSEFANNVEVVPNELYGDADGDGMPTRWEGPHHLDPYDPTGTNGPAGDPDGDQVSNWEEYIADTEPSDASNYFRFVAIAASNEMLVTYTSTNTRYYLVYYTEDATNGAAWTLLHPTAALGSNGVTTAADLLGPTTRIYRADVRLTP